MARVIINPVLRSKRSIGKGIGMHNRRLELAHRSSAKWIARLREDLDLEELLQAYRDGSLVRRLRNSAYDAAAKRIEDLDPEDEYMPLMLAAVLGIIPEETEAETTKVTAEALCRLGDMYCIGRVVEQSKETAFQLYSEAAALDSWWAVYCLAECHANGLGVPCDAEKARELLNKLSIDADAGTMLRIARNHDQEYRGSARSIHGPIRAAEKNQDEAVFWYMRAYEARSAEAADAIGDMHRKSGDESKATAWYYKATQLGRWDGFQNMAICYRVGWYRSNGLFFRYPDIGKAESLEVKIRQEGNAEVWCRMGALIEELCGEYAGSMKWHELMEEAMHWYTLASEGGCAKAAARLANARADTDGADQAAVWYLEAAEKGHVKAMVHLSDLYLKGIGAPQDIGRAVEWAERAAEEGECDGCLALGMAYECGTNGLDKDMRKALRFYEKAYGAGSATAAFWIAQIYAFGGTDQGCCSAVDEHACACEVDEKDEALFRESHSEMLQDTAEAVKWYEIAHDEGDLEAAKKLGDMYRLGLGVTRNVAEAVQWYKRAASRYSSEAMQALVDMYRGGDGVDPDPVEAAHWERQIAIYR